MKAQIVVIAEHTANRISPVTYESLSFAMELGERLDLNVSTLILGNTVEAMAKKLAERTGGYVVGVEGEQLEFYNGEAYKAATVEVLEMFNPSYICMPHTATGFDLAPRLAFYLNASCVTSVEKVRVCEGKIRFIRSMFNGKLHAEMAPATAKAVLTILPGAWPSLEMHPESKGSVHIIRTNFVPVASQTLEIKESKREKLNLGDADVIISAGRGICNPENLHLLEELAKIFPKSALGSSKAACDLGWLGYQHQIGITGQTVSSRLYIACGISGAFQHISGMRGSQTIIGINSDPDASIFNVADYGIVENLETFIPILLEEFKHFSASS